MCVLLRVHIIALGTNTFVDELMVVHRLTDVVDVKLCWQ